MSKKYSTTITLLLVESPAKCKKIEEYLGPGYKCLATYGHLREIKSLENIDIENNFIPTYTIIDNSFKKKQIENIKKAIKESSEVIIACDNDREGEKISYCVAKIFKLNIGKTKRITFNEITEFAIKKAMNEPRTIDMNLVYAQQARQILDILVGFKISPILWKYLNTNNKNYFKEGIILSAGRCQTPALKLIYENEKEIHLLKDTKTYQVKGQFTNKNIIFHLNKQYDTEDEMKTFLKGSITFNHIYNCSKPVKIFQSPPEPFTTSRILQVASNELHYSPNETMKICQILYEQGHITYMRTDSTSYSCEFMENVNLYITKNFLNSEKYINTDINNNTDINKAHEAIRPTNIFLENLDETIVNVKERKLYQLIWENSLKSCMTHAILFKVTAQITAFDGATFEFSSEIVDFPGWKIVSKKEKEKDLEIEYNYIQQIKQNSPISFKKIYANIIQKNNKLHLSESLLVNCLEKHGIGRPSTFSSIVDILKERNYVKKDNCKGLEIECKDYELEGESIIEIINKREFGNEKNKLILQPNGKLVIEFLENHFNELFNYDYTSLMEDELDKIAKGEKKWNYVCFSCNEQIDLLIEKITDLKGTDLKGTDLKGTDLKGTDLKGADIKESKLSNMIREINTNLSIRKSKNGDYLFYKTIKMKKPQFFDIKSFTTEIKDDYKICDIDILKSWMLTKYNIY